MEEYSSDDKVNMYDAYKSESIIINYADKPSFLKLVGDVKNKRIVDYGCGSGRYTREAAKTALEVVGVDLSPEMIKLAEEIDRKENIMNTKYFVRDCSEILNLGQFDMVISTYFICHASSREMLTKMVKSMYESLKPNGRLCTITFNTDFDRNQSHVLHKYNVDIDIRENISEGDPIYIKLLDSKTKEPILVLTDYYISTQVIEQVFNEVGFEDFKIHHHQLFDEFSEYKEYLSDYLNAQTSFTITATRPE